MTENDITEVEMSETEQSAKAATVRRRGTAMRIAISGWILATALVTGCAGVAVVAEPPVQRRPTAGLTPHVVYAHDINVNWIRAHVIYAHDVHVVRLKYRKLVTIKDVKGGGEDIHGDGIQADEIRAHDIHADSIVVDTLYAHKVHSSR